MPTMTTSLLEKESKPHQRAALLESAGGVRRLQADWLAVVMLLVGVLRFWVFCEVGAPLVSRTCWNDERQN